MRNKKIIKEEVNYEKIFKPETLNLLKGQSKQSLIDLGKTINLNSSQRDMVALLQKVMVFEKSHIPSLEQTAVDIVHQAYPIIKYAGVEIDAKIVTDVNAGMPEPPKIPPKESWEELPSDKKRRVINAITQGSSIRGAFAFLLFRDNLDKLDQNLVNDYNGLIKRVFGIFDDENAIAMMLAMLSLGRKTEGGKVYVKVGEDEEEKNRFDEPEPIKITIVARAICFPMLVHEIVKGLYELLSLQGFGTDKEQNQNVVRNVDQLSNEPHDMQYGKFIYDAVSNLYNESNYDDPRVRELLFVEIYKMQDEEFLIFIENAINNKLTPNQKRWAQNIMNDINNDLKKDDTGLEDLDELQINQPQKYS
jgi:hypothetical protein